MSDWETVKKELGSSNSKILYFESHHSFLIDQIDDLKNEIQSLKMIAEDLRYFFSQWPRKIYSSNILGQHYRQTSHTNLL